jgi:hypothetical protein
MQAMRKTCHLCMPYILPSRCRFEKKMEKCSSNCSMCSRTAKGACANMQTACTLIRSGKRCHCRPIVRYVQTPGLKSGYALFSQCTVSVIPIGSLATGNIQSSECRKHLVMVPRSKGLRRFRRAVGRTESFVVSIRKVRELGIHTAMCKL